MNTDAPKGQVIFSKTVKIGTIPYGQRTAPLTVEIEYGNKLNPTHKPTLSISGHYGYGNSGGWGQIVDELSNIKNYAPGWDRAKVKKLREIWQRWHMNGSRAACEHQRELPEFQNKQITISYYETSFDIRWEMSRKVAREMERTYQNYRRGDEKIPAAVRLFSRQSIAAKWLLFMMDNGLDSYEKAAITPDELKAKIKAAGLREDVDNHYTIDRLFKHKPETKWTGHTYESEHPEGFLTKPCPVCGYKYGSAWLHEDVPQDVLDWLQSL